MNTFIKIAIVLINISFIFLTFFVGGQAHQNLSGNVISFAADNNDQTDSGEFCYMRGCDNLSLVNFNRHFSRSDASQDTRLDAKIISQVEKHNDLAEQDFCQTIKLIPDCANAYWKRGRCKRNRWRWFGKPEDNFAAIADFKKAIALAPTSTEVRYNLLRAYLTSGQSELAKQEFETIIKLDPDWQNRKDLAGDMQKYDKQ